jgi:hypothetical protein
VIWCHLIVSINKCARPLSEGEGGGREGGGKRARSTPTKGREGIGDIFPPGRGMFQLVLCDRRSQKTEVEREREREQGGRVFRISP